MAEVKWIKIVTDIFDDEKILLIESMPDSDSLIVIWFKLLCLAGKQNNGGVFLMSGRIPYTEEMFATIFRRPLNTVRLALKTFESYGMIEIINNAVTIPNWEKHQQLDALEMARDATRRRVAKHREKQKLLAAGNVSGNVTDNVTEAVTVTPGNADRLDKIRIDKIKESNGVAARFTPPTLTDVQSYATEKGYSPNEFCPADFLDFYASKGWKVGRNPMKDWRASVRTWVSRYRREHPQHADGDAERWQDLPQDKQRELEDKFADEYWARKKASQ